MKQLTISLEPEVYRQLEEQAGPGRGKTERINDLARELIQRGLGGTTAPAKRAPSLETASAPKPNRAAKASKPTTSVKTSDRAKGTTSNGAAAPRARKKDMDVRQDGETPREHEALVRRMASLQEQGLTVDQIAHQMQMEGFRTRRGSTTWTQSSIRKYLGDAAGK